MKEPNSQHKRWTSLAVMAFCALLASPPATASSQGTKPNTSADAKLLEIIAKPALKPTVLASFLAVSTTPIPGLVSRGQPSPATEGCTTDTSPASQPTATAKPTTWAPKGATATTRAGDALLARVAKHGGKSMTLAQSAAPAYSAATKVLAVAVSKQP